MIQTQIVIPCFNELDGLLSLIDECLRVVELSSNSLGFILVNNGSNDGSEQIFNGVIGQYPNIEIVNLPVNQGYGGGILAGLESSNAQIIGWTHADLQTPLIDCLEAARIIDTGTSFVKGWRKGRPISDRIFSRGMGVFESVLFGSQLEEVNAQPTLFTRNFFERWQNPPTDFSLDLYALVMTVKSGLGIRRINVEFRPRQFGQSNWNFGIKSRIRFIKRTIKYSLELRRTLHENL
jgi:glycosyltransferase involved in cell wall biosynthesis